MKHPKIKIINKRTIVLFKGVSIILSTGGWVSLVPDPFWGRVLKGGVSTLGGDYLGVSTQIG